MSELKERRRGARLRLPAGAHRWCRAHCGLLPSSPPCGDEGCDVVPFHLEEEREIRVCTCGGTEHPPFCDGAHNRA